jgi:hypothetical protein
MMARSTTRSKRRPDTLMQDRICLIDSKLLQRTAGPYIGSFATEPTDLACQLMSASLLKRRCYREAAK